MNDTTDETVFILEDSWFGHHGSKIKICELSNAVIIDKPPKRLCFRTPEPLKIPFEDILAVDVDYETVEIKHTLGIGDLGFKKDKVFDSAFDNISVSFFPSNKAFFLEENSVKISAALFRPRERTL